MLALLSMGVVGAGNQVLPGASPVRYGVLFVLLSLSCAVLVRSGEHVAPVLVLPIAFAAGLVFLRDPAEMLSTLALQAPWLYGGTLAAGLIGLARGRAARKPTNRAPAGAR